MVDVFVERSFDPPLTANEIDSAARSLAPRFRDRAIEWLESMLDKEGRRMLCRFKAPEAETVRRALTDEGSAIDALWTGTVQRVRWPASHTGTAGTAQALVVAEGHSGGAALPTDPSCFETFCAWCFETHRVRLLRVIVASDLARIVHIYRAPDAESVRIAHRRAGYRPDAVWPCRKVAHCPARRAPGKST